MIFKFIECNSKVFIFLWIFEAIAAMRLESRPPLNMNPIGTSATILFQQIQIKVIRVFVHRIHCGYIFCDYGIALFHLSNNRIFLVFFDQENIQEHFQALLS